MQIQNLRNFTVVVEERNLTRAAEVLNISQPTLSRQISTLEADLGMKLFQRGKSLTLTEQGQQIYFCARDMIRLLDKTLKNCAQPSFEGGVLTIGSDGLFSSPFFARALANFHKLYPGTTFQLRTDTIPQVSLELEQGNLDLALVSQPLNGQSFVSFNLRQPICWGLLVPVNSPLAGQETIQCSQLSSVPLLVPDHRLLPQELNKILKTHTSQLNVIATYNMVSDVLCLVSAGLGFALTSQNTVRNLDPAQFRFCPLSPNLSGCQLLSWRENRLSATAELFLKYMEGLLAPDSTPKEL